MKILPDAFADDPDRLARFRREAQTFTSLNHPNIAAIHGIEEAEGTRARVLELVEGRRLEPIANPFNPERVTYALRIISNPCVRNRPKTVWRPQGDLDACGQWKDLGFLRVA